MKDVAAVTGMTAQVSPMVGVYTASARPTMKPPPTNVAVGSMCKQHPQHKSARIYCKHVPKKEINKKANPMMIALFCSVLYRYIEKLRETLK